MMFKIKYVVKWVFSWNENVEVKKKGKCLEIDIGDIMLKIGKGI